MPRSTAAYLADIVDACDGLAEVLAGVDLETYRAKRSIRTSVEREFTIIGEAVGVLSRRDPALAARISHARLIVGFRNRLEAGDLAADLNAARDELGEARDAWRS